MSDDLIEKYVEDDFSGINNYIYIDCDINININGLLNYNKIITNNNFYKNNFLINITNNLIWVLQDQTECKKLTIKIIE